MIGFGCTFPNWKIPMKTQIKPLDFTVFPLFWESRNVSFEWCCSNSWRLFRINRFHPGTFIISCLARALKMIRSFASHTFNFSNHNPNSGVKENWLWMHCYYLGPRAEHLAFMASGHVATAAANVGINDRLFKWHSPYVETLFWRQHNLSPFLLVVMMIIMTFIIIFNIVVIK